MAQYQGAAFKKSPNFAPGRHGHTVKAVVLHITAGAVGQEYPNAISWFLNPASKVSAHFVTSPGGDITQCVDTSNTAYANGLSFYTRPSELPKGWTWQGVGWYNPRAQLVRPTWQLIQQGVNPNYQTISIETAGQTGTPIPAAQMGALYALLRWLGTVHPQLLPYTPGRTLIRHKDLDPIGRAQCPGSAFDVQAIADTVNTVTKTYTFPGLKVYHNSMLTDLFMHLPEGAVLEIGQVGGVGYSAFAGHVKKATYTDATGLRTINEPGFVDVRLLQ